MHLKTESVCIRCCNDVAVLRQLQATPFSIETLFPEEFIRRFKEPLQCAYGLIIISIPRSEYLSHSSFAWGIGEYGKPPADQFQLIRTTFRLHCHCLDSPLVASICDTLTDQEKAFSREDCKSIFRLCSLQKWSDRWLD